jgi:hypothetical protein
MKTPLLALMLVAAGAAALVAGCGSGSGAEGTAVVVTGDVPLVYAKRASTLRANPTNGTPFAEGGDLMLREKSSPSAPEHNLTAQFTQGKGDAADPEVSYDGKKVVFSMKCPETNTSKIGDLPACTGRWNIWEYDMSVGGLTKGTFRRVTASVDDDDVDPAYLPAGGGFVFSSNRQTKSHLEQALGQSYYALDEYERERVINLHTMDAKGGKITQISISQSHDRNPVVRPNGDIMFSRWEHAADRNRFAVFRAKPDGTDLFVLYGAQSPGNSYLHPRDMDPAGKYKGFIASSLMPLSRTNEGGALIFIDAANYSEQDTPANTTVPKEGGNTEATQKALAMERGLSLYGRITAPYPLWDGTDRVLVGYKPCEVMKDGAVVPCATLTTEEIARLSMEDRPVDEVDADTLQDNVPPNYAIYMFDPKDQTWLNVASPPAGFMYTDPVAIQPRPEPNAPEPTNVDPTLAAANMALIEVRSVYDTDGLNRMGNQMIAASDLPSGCTVGIAQVKPADAMDTRAMVADIARLKDPADAAYGCTPVRFVRAVRAVAPPSNMMGVRGAIGETNFEQQQILGYAPIEPDGSFKLKVPADIPLALQVVDPKGRAFQTHPNWIQVRPGERRTCDGCHSPRRGAALNSGAVADNLPAALKTALASAHLGGETMASTRTRLDATLLNVQTDMVFTDVWADTAKPGVTARAPITIRYTGNANPADDLATAVPVNGVINYPEHVAPIWTRARGANTCTNCHADPAKLDLRSTLTTVDAGMSGEPRPSRMISYYELVLGDALIDAATGQPVTRLEDGVPVAERGAALVETESGAMNTAGQARKSRLTEIIFGETLLAGSAALAAHPNPPAAINHAAMLNAAEKRVIVEWMDLGGQYFNDPFNPGSGTAKVNGLTQKSFASQVLPILSSTCASGCHMPVGTNSSPAGKPYKENKFVLTGDAEGDYNVTLSMISNACDAPGSILLRKPSTTPHPAGGRAAVLPAGSANYNAIAGWIAQGCASR